MLTPVSVFGLTVAALMIVTAHVMAYSVMMAGAWPLLILPAILAAGGVAFALYVEAGLRPPLPRRYAGPWNLDARMLLEEPCPLFMRQGSPPAEPVLDVDPGFPA